MKEFKTERNYRRAGSRFYATQRLSLQKHIEKFLVDCSGQSDERIKELFEWYQSKWNEHCLFERTKENPFTVYSDAFEKSISDLHQYVKKINPNEVSFDIGDMVRVAKMFRKQTRFQKFMSRFSKKQTKQMSVVQ